MEGIGGEVTSPLMKGKGHGIIGELEFIEEIRNKFLKKLVRHRELPAIRRVAGRLEPGRVVRVVSDVAGFEREELLKRGRRGSMRGLLMEMLYRHGGLNQREIGEFLGVALQLSECCPEEISANGR